MNNKFRVDERLFREIEWIDLEKDEDDIVYLIAEKYYKGMTTDDLEMEGIDVDEMPDLMYEYIYSIINVGKFNKESLLANALRIWYGSYEDMLDNIRNGVEYDDYYYFETGCGYNIIDADLLGGNGNGETVKEFLEMLNN